MPEKKKKIAFNWGEAIMAPDMSKHIGLTACKLQTDREFIDQVTSHARTVVRECCKGDDESQWERGKFDPPPPKNPLTDGHQNLCR